MLEVPAVYAENTWQSLLTSFASGTITRGQRHDWGIAVKLSAENQLLLNVTKPSRVFIPARLLEKCVKGFRVGRPMMLQAWYAESGSRAYHKYVGGNTWVPTAPAAIGKPGDVFTLKVSPLTTADFLQNFPVLRLGNSGQNTSLGNETSLRTTGKGDEVEFLLQQAPPVEGFRSYAVSGKVAGDLVFQTGSVFLNVSVPDAFSANKTLRLYHNGHTRAWLAVGTGRAFFQVKFLSFDGLRLKFLYRWTNGRSINTFYMKRPSLLYQLGDISQLPLDSYNIAGIDQLSLVEDVVAIRQTERDTVVRGSAYDLGRVGAEIAYTIMRNKLKLRDIVLHEPARRGADLRAEGGAVVAEARLISRIPKSKLKAAIEKELMQMIRKLWRDLRHSSRADVGYAILSYAWGEQVQSLIARVDYQRG